jgi:site-specific DNA recombinase
VIRTAIYARISSDREGDNLAVSRQLADCEALAGRRGWRVVERYVDSDISAYSGKQRPEYLRMLEDIEVGAVEAVVVYHADRLHRHPRELEDFIDLCQRTKTRLATVSGDVDLSTHEGQLIARIQGAVARKESDDKSRRIRRKHEELASAGKVSGGGSRPYGYEPDKRTVRPEEAEMIRDCARRALAGDSLRSICLDLNERGIASAGGKRWSSQTLRRMLMSARISGQREHRGEIVAKAEWPAIISPRETQQLRAKLGDPERRTNRASRRYLLTRLLAARIAAACSSPARALTARAAMSVPAAPALPAVARQPSWPTRSSGSSPPGCCTGWSRRGCPRRSPAARTGPMGASGRPRSSARRRSLTSWLSSGQKVRSRAGSG